MASNGGRATVATSAAATAGEGNSDCSCSGDSDGAGSGNGSGGRILDIPVVDTHQRTPLFIGSVEQVTA